MNQVEKKLMDEFANTTLQSAFQSAFQHSDFAAQGYEDKAEFCYNQAKAMVQARAKAQGSHYIKNEVFPL